MLATGLIPSNTIQLPSISRFVNEDGKGLRAQEDYMTFKWIPI